MTTSRLLFISLAAFSICQRGHAVIPVGSYRLITDHHLLSSFDVEAVVPDPMLMPLPEGVRCDEKDNCVAGQCLVDDASGVRNCHCSTGAFRYWLAVPGINVCLKCRSLQTSCSLDEECQCGDQNTICYGATGVRKGHCQCRWILDSGNATTCPVSPQEQCGSTLDCQTSVRFLDAAGQIIASPPDSLICTPVNASQPLFVADTNDLLLPEIPSVSPEARLLNRTTKHGCVCPAGFQPSANDSYTCQDVDECADLVRGNPCMPQLLENAEVTCVNTIGSYRCECHSGFALGQGLAPHGICCQPGHVPCLDSSKCVPMFKLCNGVPECTADCSDELYPFCNFNSNRPFPDFLHYPQCHELLPDNVEPSTARPLPIELPPHPKNESTTVELLPLGSPPIATETPPAVIPTLPSNVTAARLLGYVLI